MEKNLFRKKSIIGILIVAFISISVLSLETSIAKYVSSETVAYVDLDIKVNLYGKSEIYNEYYTEEGVWGTNEDYPDIVSMLVDVEPGDKILANSFLATPDNNGTMDGIRITFLDDDTIVSSLSNEEVYAIYLAKGYVTAPANVNKANISWWTADESNYLYITKSEEGHNLYDTTKIDTKYYDANGNYVENNDVVSMMVEVEPGNCIVANSFLAAGWNGNSSQDGVRISFLKNNEVVGTLSPAEVYNEYIENNCVIVPDDVDEVNIPWWSDSTDNYLYITRDNSIEDANNLYDNSKVVYQYYNVNGELITDKPIVSMMVDVTPGNQIFANSFLSTPYNQGNYNGIRITYFNDDTIVKTLSPSEVYSEVSKFYNLEVPRGANKASITWYNENIYNYLYINDDVILDESNYYNERLVESKYYNANGEYVSGGAIVSMMFDVNPGDMLDANSFKKSGENNGARDGIRISYFSDDTFLYSVEPEKLYHEYNLYGYVTVPEGVNKVSVSWWTADESNYLYITEGTSAYQQLYDSSTVQTGYYNSSGTFIEYQEVVSTTVSVNPGDTFIANSFQASGTNGGTQNGIRITYLLDGTVISSLSGTEVYNEYSTNGYLTVPEGVNQVSVPWWTNVDTNYLFVYNKLVS